MKKLLLLLLLIIVNNGYLYSQTIFSTYSSEKEKVLKFKVDSLITHFKNSNLRDSIQNKKQIDDELIELNKTTPYEIITSAGFTNFEDFKKTFANASLGVRIRISKYKAKLSNTKQKYGRLDPDYLYFEYRTKTPTSPDSSILAKTFIFPQINKHSFVFGYYHQWTTNGWDHWLPIFEFSLNTYSDTLKNKFTSQAFLLGYRITKSFPDNKDKWVMFMPYFKFINVDKKYKTAYNTILGEESLPHQFTSLGLEMAFGPQETAFFCNMNYLLTKDPTIKNVDLKGFTFTVGARALLSPDRFKISKK